MMKVGLCSVTFRKKTVEEIIEIALDNKLNFIERGGDVHLLPGDYEKAKKIKALCKKNNILYSYGSYYKYRKDDDIDLILKTTEILGAKDLRVWPTRLTSKDTNKLQYHDLDRKSVV